LIIRLIQAVQKWQQNKSDLFVKQVYDLTLIDNGAKGEESNPCGKAIKRMQQKEPI